jgi:hypothetical protein
MAQTNQGSFSKYVPPALPFKPDLFATIKLTHYPEPISWAGETTGTLRTPHLSD